jgi:hypothetical protein
MFFMFCTSNYIILGALMFDLLFIFFCYRCSDVCPYQNRVAFTGFKYVVVFNDSRFSVWTIFLFILIFCTRYIFGYFSSKFATFGQSNLRNVYTILWFSLSYCHHFIKFYVLQHHVSLLADELEKCDKKEKAELVIIKVK